MTPFRDFARSKRPKLFSRGFWTRTTAGASMCMIQLFGSGALYTQKGDKITSASPTLLSLPLIVSLFLVFCKPKEEGRQAGRQAGRQEYRALTEEGKGSFQKDSFIRLTGWASQPLRTCKLSDVEIKDGTRTTMGLWGAEVDRNDWPVETAANGFEGDPSLLYKVTRFYADCWGWAWRRGVESSFLTTVCSLGLRAERIVKFRILFFYLLYLFVRSFIALFFDRLSFFAEIFKDMPNSLGLLVDWIISLFIFNLSDCRFYTCMDFSTQNLRLHSLIN